MTSVKDTVKVLSRNWGTINEELFNINKNLIKLSRRKAELLSQLDGLLRTFDVLGERPDNLIIPPELEHKPEASIGDIMEKILRDDGPLTKSALIERLQKYERLNTKNARVILANAIKRDGRQRFAVENGKVSLAKEGK